MTPIILILHFLAILYNVDASFLIGRGIADATGIIAEGVLYGYANPSQDARGIHLRQFSRTFIMADSGDTQRLVFVVVECPMISQAVHTGVMERLSELYGNLYTARNVLLSPTHSHSTPGGFHTYWMYNFPSGGSVPQTYEALVDGIVRSIVSAHEDLQPGSILVGTGELTEASINRSPAAYDNNPQEEQDSYKSNFESEMTVLKFMSDDGQEMGMLDLFPVHTTSMKNYNKLVSTDNKGVAAFLFERQMNPESHPGKGSFVAAFSQTNEGDVSPNTDGARCLGTDELCDYLTSSCEANVNDPTLCESYGPTGDQFEDCRISGTLQYEKALEVYKLASEEISGDVRSAFQWVNMSDVTVNMDNQTVRTCRPAMGFSFAAGATDGPGTFPFTQGDTEGDAVIEGVVGAVLPKSEELVQCHLPKPILLPTGEAAFPNPDWPWQPEIVPIQVASVGNIVFLGVPGEVTTMAGRRLQRTVKEALVGNGYPESTRVFVMSMANSYASYITTYEEYQVQRYEGASTIYGPYTLDAYLQTYAELSTAMANEAEVEVGEAPPDLRAFPGDSVGNIRRDTTPEGLTYGDVVAEAEPVYTQGSTVSVTFVSGNPRNDLRTEGTYLEVQRQTEAEQWEVVATDAYWETKLYWTSDCHDVVAIFRCPFSQGSNVTITWDIPANQSPGIYRIVHDGNAMTTDGQVPYQGVSAAFSVEAARRKFFSWPYGYKDI